MTCLDKVNKLHGLLDRITIIQTEDQLQVWQTSFLQPNQVRILTFLNAHGVNLSMQKGTFLATFSDADAILRWYRAKMDAQEPRPGSWIEYEWNRLHS